MLEYRRNFAWVLPLILVGACAAPRPAAAPAPPATQPSAALPATAPPATSPPAAVSSAPTPLPAFVDPRQTVPFLASDAMAGRAPGTAGLIKAGDFLADEFRRIGLSPVPGLAGFFQPFTMPLTTTLGVASLAIDDKPLILGTDFQPMPITGEGPFSGGVVFAGYGITRDGYDDYDQLNAAGKVVLAMRLEPRDAAGHSRFASGFRQWSDSAAMKAKAANAAAHGAAALLLVSPPSSGGEDLLDPFSASQPSPLPVIAVTRRVADLLLSLSGDADLASLQNGIDAAAKPRSFPLTSTTMSGDLSLVRHSAQVRNVVAQLPGTGPHADEIVVVGAHYDHLGVGQLGYTLSRRGQIFHGADDNASGTAALLELADRLKQAGPLPRTVVFCCFTGEEEGLIGSSWFVKHPPIPLDHVVAMLNLDMVGRLRNDDLLIGGWGTAPAFDSIVQHAIAGTGLHTHSFEKGGLGPSDHMSFALQHIPVLFYFTGLHADYHRPTDTADKINYAGIDEIAGVCVRTVDELATMPRQSYDASSDATSTMAYAAGTAPHGGGQAALGVVPDFNSFDETAGGVRISGVGQNSPAQRAGLQDGDIILRFAGKPMQNLQDLSDALAAASPGDVVQMQVQRGKRRLQLQATLGQRGDGE